MTRLALLAAAVDQHRGPLPELAGTIEFETSFGALYLDETDPVITPGLVAVGEWEPGVTALLGAYLRPGMTLIDVGAHVGYYSCLAGRLVGPRGLVVAFEPNRRNFELLQANVWRNGLTNVVCFPWAVAEQPGFAQLYLSADNSGDHRIYAHEAGRSTTPVRVAALDALEVLRPPVDVVKIDVQGSEELVFRGAERLLAASPEAMVVVEFAPKDLREAGANPRRVLDYYRSLGYTVRVQHSEQRGVLELPDDEIFDFCAGNEGKPHTNLVLTKR